ncbi:hypothetical protein PENTCL1PPCAC_7333, partial [Pristionchus entomophagus]
SGAGVTGGYPGVGVGPSAAVAAAAAAAASLYDLSRALSQLSWNPPEYGAAGGGGGPETPGWGSAPLGVPGTQGQPRSGSSSRASPESFGLSERMESGSRVIW